MPPRYTIRQVVGTYRRKAFGTCNDDGTPRRPAYPPDAIAAFYGMLELAEEQPRRGHFESERLLRVLLEGPNGRGRRFARQVPFLITQGDLVPADLGGLDVEGWQILQEGDTTIADRVARFRSRQRADPAFHDPLTGAQRTALYRLRQRVFERDSFTCRYCGTADSPREWLIAEHVIPDGPTTEENLVTACRGCNKRKGGRTPEEAGMPLLPVTPRDGDVTLPDAVTRDVTGDAWNVTGETVTPRTGDVRAPRRARNAVATATRLDGYEAREARATTWFDGETPEGPALSWLAEHGAALAPDGNGLHVKLARLVEIHGAREVVATFETIAPDCTEARQFVLGADNLLNRIPAAPKAPDSEEQASSRRSDRERASLRAEQARRAAMLAADEAPA